MSLSSASKNERKVKAQALLEPQVSNRQGQVFDVHISEEVERHVLRKIDLVILPLMCVVFFFQYLDKTSIAYAAVFGMRTDTHLQGQEYSWLTTMFYLGQFVSEYPFTYLLAVLPISRFVGISIIVWGGVCMCIAAVQNFAGFATVRFLLGMSEGAVSPAFVLITSYWYKRSEHPTRVAAWISFNGLAQIIGALFMYAIGKIDSAIASWRLMFLITGALTVLFGIAFTLVMPKSPATAWFLKEDERQVAQSRLVLDQLTEEHHEFSWTEVQEALLDPKVWCLFCVAVITCITASVITFGAIIIAGFGHSSFTTMLLGLPAGGIQIFFICVGVFAMKYIPNSRAYTGALLSIIPLVGSILLLVLPLSATWGLVVSCWIATVISDIFVVALSLCASNVKGNTKKSVVNVIYFIGYCVGCCIGPQFWKTDQAPRYRSGCIANVVCYSALIAIFLIYRILCLRDNKKRDALVGTTTDADSTVETGSQGSIHKTVADRVAAENLTDRRDMNFRYVL